MLRDSINFFKDPFSLFKPKLGWLVGHIIHNQVVTVEWDGGLNLIKVLCHVMSLSDFFKKL